MVDCYRCYSDGILFALVPALTQSGTRTGRSPINPNSLKILQNMKNADKPFIGLILLSIAILYGVIAILS
jgi:hypothetical protein